MTSQASVKAIQECIFGNQKQANATNQAVVYLISKELDRVMNPPEFNDYREAADCIRDYLLKAVTEGADYCDDKIISLIVGVPGFSLIKTGKNVNVACGQKTPDSPKFIFQIQEALPDPITGKETGFSNVNKPGAKTTLNYRTEEGSFTHGDGSPMELATIERDKILKIIPSSRVESFGGNMWAAAMFFAKAYYTGEQSK